ncbi:MAG: helical backbone metal receptor [Acidobacteriota bacterium]
MTPGRRFVVFIALAATLSSCRRPAASALRDDLGREVRVPAPVARVVTLAPNVTEIVAAIGCSSLLVGTDNFSNVPSSVASLPKVGGVQPSPELIARLSPDLVVASSSGSPGLSSVLASMSIPMYSVRTDRSADVSRVMTALGTLMRCGKPEAAKVEFEKQLSAQRRSRPSHPRVLFAVWPDPLYVAARETFVDDLFELTGAQNAVAPSVKGWPQYSLEAVIANPPDIILYPRASGRKDGMEAMFRTDSRWRALPAVSGNRLFAVDEDLFSRPGPRLPRAAAILNEILDSVEKRK